MNSIKEQIKLTVLVIDDNPLELGLIRLVLQKNFPDVKCIALTRVPDWESFLRAQKIDVVIIDYRMPEKNGIEHIKELRKYDKDVYAFLITALERDEIDQDITNSGATDIIVKDRSYSNLISKLNNVLLNESVKQIEEELTSLKFILDKFSDLLILKINDEKGCVDLSGNIEKFQAMTEVMDLKSGWKNYFEQAFDELKLEIESGEEVPSKSIELMIQNKSFKLQISLLKSRQGFYLIVKPL
jgi:response regulator RpfG family c-di-GMP phosphodiesterase